MATIRTSSVRLGLSGVPLAYVTTLCKSTTTLGDAAPTAIGSGYYASSEVPTDFTRVLFRVVMSSSSAAAGDEAVVDLYDSNGVLNAGVPAVVAGSEVDTTTGSVPLGAPAADPLVPTTYEADVTAAFAGFSGKGSFEARLWCSSGAALATCGSAELIFTR